jgi:hypothetical protein
MTLRTAIFAAAAIALLQMGALAQSSKMYRVGLISILGPGMVRDFAKRGYALDCNIVFERRAAEGRFERVRNFLSLADTKRTHRG